MLFNLIPAITLVLLIFSSEAVQKTSSMTQDMQKSSLSKVQSSDCSYNGSINNSTAIELGNCFNNLYYIGLNIGTGPQYFNFKFDTGSPTLWISQGTNPKGFQHKKSSTYKITNQQNGISYEGGTVVAGFMGSDIVSPNGTSLSINGSILFAEFSNTTFPNTKVYGLIGMDYGSYPNFLDVAYQNGQISTPVFSLDLNNQNQTSWMYYNNGLPQQVSTNTLWVNNSGSSFYQVEVIGASVDGVDMTSLAANNAVIDSGTSFIILNPNLYNQIVQQYFSSSSGCTTNSDGLTYCPCSMAFPQLGFTFQGTEVYVPGTAYQISAGNNSCLVAIQQGSNTSQIILGDVFFRNYIITFDRIKNRIGFYNGVIPAGVTISVFDPMYFAILQYIICGFCIAMTFTGVGLWLHITQSIGKRLKYTSGTQQNLKIGSYENHQID